MAGPEQPIEPAQDAISPHAPALEGTLLAASLERLPVPQVHGWLLPALLSKSVGKVRRFYISKNYEVWKRGRLETDTVLTGRGDYWTECMVRGVLPNAPIPRQEFLTALDKAT
jgi:hypothetical protein